MASQSELIAAVFDRSNAISAAWPLRTQEPAFPFYQEIMFPLYTGYYTATLEAVDAAVRAVAADPAVGEAFRDTRADLVYTGFDSTRGVARLYAAEIFTSQFFSGVGLGRVGAQDVRSAILEDVDSGAQPMDMISNMGWGSRYATHGNVVFQSSRHTPRGVVNNLFHMMPSMDNTGLSWDVHLHVRELLEGQRPRRLGWGGGAELFRPAFDVGLNQLLRGEVRETAGIEIIDAIPYMHLGIGSGGAVALWVTGLLAVVLHPRWILRQSRGYGLGIGSFRSRREDDGVNEFAAALLQYERGALLDSIPDSDLFEAEISARVSESDVPAREALSDSSSSTFDMHGIHDRIPYLAFYQDHRSTLALYYDGALHDAEPDPWRLRPLNTDYELWSVLDLSRVQTQVEVRMPRWLRLLGRTYGVADKVYNEVKRVGPGRGPGGINRRQIGRAAHAGTYAMVRRAAAPGSWDSAKRRVDEPLVRMNGVPLSTHVQLLEACGNLDCDADGHSWGMADVIFWINAEIGTEIRS